ncbi:putative tetratricopeptide repeat-containing domain protein [Roseburia sp. CAG:303]|nr:putative tetratricopeptide repeat-containing domain protein [Roseburia sp. CAG:303]
MDKYEYNVKLEQIKKLIRKKDYATAARIADTIDWYKVKNNQTIVLIADVYEASGRYEQARENLKLAYDRSGLGRQIAYKLVKVCIKCGKIDEAEDFYDDFVSAAPRDISKYLLQYELAKAKGEPLEKQISILEQYLEEDMDDRWAFELAKLYHKTGQRDKCIEQCDTVMLWFSDGKYVDKAMDLKMIYTPLTKSQQQRYEARWREKSAQNNIKIEEIKVKEVDVANKYNTQNIQNALKESMDQIFAKEEKAKDEAAELFKPLQKKEPEEPDDYSEADGAAEDADDYIARMALNAMTYENQRKQGMAAVADDEFEEEKEEEEKDDLGDTKIFVTTRSKKNLGDTKVFDPRKLVIPEQVSFEREEQPVKEEKKSEPEEAYIVEEKTIKREEIKEELPEEEPEIEETAETVEEPVEEEAVEEQPAEETVEEAVEETAETVEEPVEEVVEEPVEEIVEEQSVEEEHAEEEVAEKEEIPEEEPEDSTKETVVEVEPGVMEQLMEGLFSDDLFAAATTEPEVKEEPETVEAEEAVEEPEIEKSEEAAEEPEIEEVEDEPELEESFDGQYSFGFEEPEEDIEEEQIEGQMSLDDFFNEEGEYHVPEVDEEDDIETEPELDEEEPAVELDEVDEPEEAEVVEEEYDEADEPEVIEEEYEEPDELEVIEEEYDEPDELEIIEEEYDEADEPEIIGEEAVQDEAEEPEEVREAAVTEEEDEETEENEEIDPFETVTELKIDKNLIKHSSDFEEDSEEPDETDEDGEIEESGEEEPEDDEDEQEDQESEDDEDEKEPLSNQEIKQIIKDFIGKYSGVQGLDKQMLRTLQNVIVDDNCNIFIMGDAKSGKTSLGIDIIKVVNKIKRNNNRRIAKISADKLIGKEMAVYFDKLKGSDLFIENISLMDDNTLEDLLDAIDNDRDSRIIVIEDEKVNADKLLERHGELRDYFANRIVVKQNKIKDWVAIAQEYAEEKGYEIDEIGLLALHAKIDQLYGVTLVIQRNHVENVIDNAIKKAEKGGLFKKFFGRKKDKVLTEEHFN